MVVSVQKSDVETAETPFLARVPITRPTIVADPVASEQPIAPLASELPDEPLDRALRQRIILGNVIAWLVIILAVRLIFF
jgi:hypothetical protein